MRTRVWIDFWNFQATAWKQIPGVQINWSQIGRLAVQKASTFGHPLAGLQYVQTRIFASRCPADVEIAPGEAKLLHTLVTTSPDIALHVLPRAAEMRPCKCPDCGHRWEDLHYHERDIDVSIACDIARMVHSKEPNNRTDAVVIASRDSDFIPVANLMKRWNIPVINLGFQEGGYRLANVCDAMVTLQELGPEAFTRPRRRLA